jgi:hypothetical protein
MSRGLAFVFAIFIGAAAVAIPTVLQPRLQAGSVPDLVCSLILAPGLLIANLFYVHEPGIASPEFRLLLSRLVTFNLFAVVAYGILSIKKPTI